MANPQRKQSITKEPGYMDEPPDLIRATMDIDLDEVFVSCGLAVSTGFINTLGILIWLIYRSMY